MDAPIPAPPPFAVERALLERFVEAGEVLPAEVRSAVLALDRAGAITLLVTVLSSEALADVDSPGDGFAPIHAVALLRELRATEAIEPMLRALVRHDPLDVLCNDLVLALQALGPPVLEPALAAHARAETDVQRTSIADVLSGVGVRDERVLAILLSLLEREPRLGAGLLASYGDPAALPRLVAALDGCEPAAGPGLLAGDAAIELANAIEELGGALTADQRRKLDEARAMLRGAAPRRPGRAPVALPGGAEVVLPEEEEDDEDDVTDDPDERARLLERFAASPHAAEVRDDGWIDLMLEYAADYVGAPFADLDGEALDEIVFEIFPRKVSCEPGVAPEVVRSLRAFWTFARDVLAHPHAQECLALLGERAAARLERELSDPSNYGLAKSFVMSTGGPNPSGRLDGPARTSTRSRAERAQKKKLRKQRKKARRRNRR